MKKLSVILLGLCLIHLTVVNTVYSKDNALQNAEDAIQAYFNAILTGESTLSPNMAMAEAIKEVPDRDQSSLGDYYSQTSITAAKKAIDAYAQKVTAGQDASNTADSMHEIEDALGPDDFQKTRLYYDQVKKKNPKMVEDTTTSK